MGAALTSYFTADPPIRKKFTGPWSTSIKQKFSLPSTIIYNIAMNPSSPKAYNKLIQTCKFFFERNSIFVVGQLSGALICSNDKTGHRECCVKIDINKISSKFWFTRELELYRFCDINFKLFRPKIYRCDIVTLEIIEETVKFDDFIFFGLSAKVIILDEAKIVYNNGHPVMLENILEALPNLETLFCEFENNSSMVSSSTAKNILKLKNLRNLRSLTLCNIDQSFDLNDLLTFIKGQRGIKFVFNFADDISDEYKNQLDGLIDSVIQILHLKALIFYDGQNQEKLKILRELFSK